MKISLEEKSPKTNKVKEFFKKFKSVLEGIFYPANIKCINCNVDLPQKQEIEFCENCLSKLEFIENDKCCKRCGAKLKTSNLCLACKSNKREFKLARSVMVYDGIASRLIKNFKYQNKPYMSRTFGKLLAKKFVSLNWKVDFITFVPITKKKEKKRGFNQARLLAEEFYKNTGVQLEKDILIKKQETKEQASLGFKDRQENLRKSFKVTNKDKVFGKSILLIDDVFTTGATANACSLAFKKAGAKEVFVLTVASTSRKILGIEDKKQDEKLESDNALKSLIY